LKIVMVSGHGCIRVHKMAIPLIEKGHEVHLLAFKASTFWEQYKTFSLCYDVEQMLEAMKVYAHVADVFHCHNEPSWFVSALKEITNKPVILDVHDSYLARSTPEEATERLDTGAMHLRVTAEERNNFQLADALVFPGEGFRSSSPASSVWAAGAHAAVLRAEALLQVQVARLARRPGLRGPGQPAGGERAAGAQRVRLLRLHRRRRRAKAMGMDFHLYAGRGDEKFLKHYGETAFIHRPLLYEELLDMVGKHDWGLVGNTVKTKEWDVAMPNKLFEYMATGVPVVAMNAADCSKFVKDTGVGIAVEGPEELGERWKEHRDCRGRVFKERQAWSMNAHIHKLEKFYKEVTA
jgi:hypothetical protein